MRNREIGAGMDDDEIDERKAKALNHGTLLLVVQDKLLAGKYEPAGSQRKMAGKKDAGERRSKEKKRRRNVEGWKSIRGGVICNQSVVTTAAHRFDTGETAGCL